MRYRFTVSRIFWRGVSSLKISKTFFYVSYKPPFSSQRSCPPPFFAGRPCWLWDSRDEKGHKIDAVTRVISNFFLSVLVEGILLSKLTQAKVIATRSVQDCNTNNTNKTNSIKNVDMFVFFPLTHFIDCFYHSDVTQQRPNLSHTAPNSVQKQKICTSTGIFNNL